MGKDAWDSFWEWNKKMLSDTSPAIAWKVKDDGRGNKEEFYYFFGSWFYHKEGNDHGIEEQNMRLKEQNEKLGELLMNMKKPIKKTNWLEWEDD